MKLLKGFKVLIVDDDPDLLEVVSEDFEIAGADVHSASSGKEAILFVKAHKYDFVLSDMRMPNGDGRFLALEIASMIGPKPLIFFYSGFNDVTDSESIELAISEIFAKPFVAADMVKSILAKFKDRRAV